MYHLMLDELSTATEAYGTAEQKSVLEELIGQRRLLSFDRLLSALII